MSLLTASRGDKKHLEHLWKAANFDFERACRQYGRNDAFWVLCYRMHLAGIMLPDEKMARKFVRAANRATGGLNQAGERERYTFYEATQTIEQVRRYKGKGLLPLIAKRRKTRSQISPQARKVLEAACEIASKASCSFFYASHRRLGAMAGVNPCVVSGLLYELEGKNLLFRRGFTKPFEGRARGTTCLSLKPERPLQRVDELEPPTWDAHKARWVWSSLLAKGTLTYSRMRWLARQMPSAAASVPYVYEDQTSRGDTPASAFSMGMENPLRGSP